MKKRTRSPLTRCSLHDWASLRSELLFIFDQPAPLGSLRVSGIRHEGDLSAWLVRKGRVRIEADGECAEARPGHWLVCFGREICQEIAPGTHLLSLRVLHGWPGGRNLFAGSPLQRLDARRHPRLGRLALALLRLAGGFRVRLAREGDEDPREAFLWQTRLDYLTYVRYERTMLAWMGEWTRAMLAEGREIQAPDEADPRLARAFGVVDSLLPSAAFPEETLERVCGLSVGRLNRLSARDYGFTVHGYWERRRIERAKLALEQPAIQIKEIASELGFVQLSHFSAWFKRNAGLPPRAFRQRRLEPRQAERES